MATAAAVDVFPTPPLPPKNTNRSLTLFLGYSSSFNPDETLSIPGVATLLSDTEAVLVRGITRDLSLDQLTVDAEEMKLFVGPEFKKWRVLLIKQIGRVRRTLIVAARGKMNDALVLLAVKQANERRAAGNDRGRRDAWRALLE